MSDRLIDLRSALVNFVDATETQSQSHIKLLHQHIVQRLVVEGGFHPDGIVPRPPFQVEVGTRKSSRQPRLIFDPSAAVSGELTILGGLKTKDVDVVVVHHGIGPCLAISVKGTLNAFRNLTNRMEEAAGDCTNLHISYPNLVYGYFHVIRATNASEAESRNDVAIDENGNVVDGILRYHDAIARLSGRKDVRDDVSRYEAISLALVEAGQVNKGQIHTDFPSPDSVIRIDGFFASLYSAYDLRYVYAAPALRGSTSRNYWAPDSPALTAPGADDFNWRLAD